MKLQRKSDKRKTILLIALGIVLLALVVGLAISLLTPNNEEPSTIVYGIQIASYPYKTEYQVGEKFDPTGAKIQVVTSNNEETYFVDYTQLEFSGFDNTAVNDALVITVKYMEHSTTFTVKVVNKETPVVPDPESSNIEICDMILEYTLSRWNGRGPSTYGAYAKITRPDGTVYGSLQETPLSNDNIQPYEKMTEPGATTLTIIYVDKDGTEYKVTLPVNVTAD